MIVAGAREIEGLDEERGRLLAALLERADAHAERFETLPAAGGLDLRRAPTEDRPAGRPRILLFPADKGRLVAFFYKPSRLHFSTDRFSYGALYLYAARIEPALADFEAGLDFLAGDFKPARRPARLKRSLDVTVPGD